MEKSMDLLGGLRSIMQGERELLLCFGCAEVRKKSQSEAESYWGGKGKVYIYP